MGNESLKKDVAKEPQEEAAGTEVNILFIGTHPDLVATVVRLINNHSAWQATAALDAPQARSLFGQKRFDLVMFGSGIAPDAEKELRDYFAQTKPHMPVIQHYGGGSGLLSSEIMHALRQQRREV